MPTFTKLVVTFSGGRHRTGFKTLEYAEEAELLDFANKVREAGGGNPIEGFFPSVPSDPNACLIARALNFGCRVEGYTSSLWSMQIEGTDDNEIDRRVRAIAKATGCRFVTEYDEYGPEDVGSAPGLAYQIILPERIGNTADAFDNADDDDDAWVAKYRDTDADDA